jgi:hypothetical protein
MKIMCKDSLIAYLKTNLDTQLSILVTIVKVIDAFNPLIRNSFETCILAC